MTPDERELISGLFDRMRTYELPQKDRDAEALINQAVRAMPDAPYMLVQSVLVQEQALEAANARVQDLEARVRELEGSQPQQSGGSFLGGLFGGGGRPDPERRPSSVPAIGSRAGGVPSMLPGRPQAAQETAQPATGGFMRTAMATAAGVAGGMLLAEGIRNMMGGSGAQAQTAASGDSGDKKAEQVDDDPGIQEASYDPSRNDTPDWGGDWGGDLDV